MAIRSLSRLIQTIRQASICTDLGDLTDGQLLESYVRSRQEAAFAALVHRHGPMVWGVCRRLLWSHHDVEDAFQATFLVLVRKATSIAHREKLANWLYGVAHQTALKARAKTTRRQTRELGVTVMPEPFVDVLEPRSDLQTLLDQELSRLPAKYRAIIVLCDLEGKTRKEAAREFHVPEGTVASRLATARAMLGKRLARRGCVLSGGSLAATLAREAASASVPSSIMSSTIQAATLFAVDQVTATGVLSVNAVALAERVLKSMLLTKLKITATVLLALAVVATGTAAVRPMVPPETPAVDLIEPISAQTPAARGAEEQPGSNRAAAKEKPIRNLAGSVKAVDAEKKTITVANAQGVNTYSVATDAEIWIDGQAGKLTGLPPGPTVFATVTLKETTILRIDAKGQHFPFATVKSIDPEKLTITFDDDKAPPELAGMTFPVAKDAHIIIDGNSGQLTGVPPGSVMSLHLGVSQKTICYLHAAGPVFEGIHAVVVKAVDPAKNTITFDEDKSPPDVAGITFPLAKNVDITVDSQPAKLADVPTGALVNLTLSVDRKTARVIQAVGSGMEHVIVKAVDPARCTITIANTKAGERTLAVSRSAEIMIDGKPGKLATLPSKAIANLWLRADQSTVQRVEAYGASVSGSAQAVDPGNKQVTVAGKTIPVAKDCDILIDGKRGELGGIPKGAGVDVLLSVDQLTAIRINAEGARITGVVQSVDADKQTITVAGVTYPVAMDAIIELDRKKSMLAAIPKGAQLNPLILSVDQRTVRVIYAARP
jgi:RNA polymerase sigma factor (sigma-70 family)